MSINPVTLLKTRIKSAKSTIQSATSDERTNHASVQTMDLVNKLIADLSEQCPDLASSLPGQFKNVSPHASMLGKSDHTYMDLEIFIDQLLSLIELVDE